MTKFRMNIEVHAENEHEAKVFYEATKHQGMGGKMTVAASGEKEYWTVDIDPELEGVALDELRKQLDFLESIERTV